MQVRPADESEIDELARVWFDGWHDAHARILPAELARVRTRASFEKRLRAELDTVRVIGPIGAPLGFCMVKDAELYQLYVSAPARGSGISAALLADAEARLARNHVEIAWLACAMGNERAARFYEKSGWRRAGTFLSRLGTETGTSEAKTVDVEVWRYEKRLEAPSRPRPRAE